MPWQVMLHFQANNISTGIKSKETAHTALPQYFITMAVDITDRKQSEDELRKLKEHLETEVAEKTRELKNRVTDL